MLEYDLNTTIILILFILHFFGDYVGQTKRNLDLLYKSHKALFQHSLFYSMCFLFLFPIELNLNQITVFIIITFIAHYITDYFGAKVRNHYFNNQNLKMTNLASGLDLIVHYIQIVFTFIFVKLYF